MTGGFRARARRPLAEHGFLRVEEVEVDAPGGAALRRVVVRHPGAVVVVPLRDEATAVLVRQYRAAVDAELLELPAGKRDVAGEPPATTARRELAEETGLRAAHLECLGEFYNSPGFTDEHSVVYLARDLTDGERAPSTGEEEHLTLVDVALDDVERLVEEGLLVDGKSIIGLLLARSRLASGS